MINNRNSGYPDDIHDYDNNPRSPFFNGITEESTQEEEEARADASKDMHEYNEGTGDNT